jgi:hypothetical protein
MLLHVTVGYVFFHFLMLLFRDNLFYLWHLTWMSVVLCVQTFIIHTILFIFLWLLRPFHWSDSCFFLSHTIQVSKWGEWREVGML